YELLFTSNVSNREKIRDLSSEAGVNITEIGIITENKRVELYGHDNKILKYGNKGFVHLY
ncbi:MAG: thiamine-phosphate kinase, partial [Candidatus Dadabacteria bacterium]|nr:thiamine-phosphate kinase [Candidatus Dadabacteria bacterium]